MKRKKLTINDFDDDALEIIDQFVQCRMANNIRVPEPWGSISQNYRIERTSKMNDYDFELLPDDYWDSETEKFVITRGKDDIKSTAKIKDHDGVIWNCYLVGMQWFPNEQMEIYYRCF